MPEIQYDKALVRTDKVDYKFNKLSLKKDEKARLVLIEKNPVFEWTHELKRPKITEGEPVYTMTTPARGEPRRVNDMDFLSRPICLGDLGTLEETGLDAKSCPMCALAAKDPDATKPPVRRFATHVIRYKTRGGTFDVLSPFQVELFVWSFTERMYGIIADFKEEWGDLRARDLNFECTNQQFQNYEINVASKSEMLADENRKALIKEVYLSQKIEDLSIACGRRTERRWIDEDIKKINEAWGEVRAFEARGTGTLADDLSSIADDKAWEPEAPKSAPAETPVADASALDDLFDGIDDSEPKEAITPDAVDASGLDDLTDALGAAADEEEAEAAAEEPAAEPEPAPAKKAPAKAPAKAAAKPAAASVEDDLDALLG